MTRASDIVLRLAIVGLLLLLIAVLSFPQADGATADYPLCLKVRPGPLVKHKGVVLYPNRGDLT